jgi:hypothetical protein
MQGQRRMGIWEKKRTRGDKRDLRGLSSVYSDLEHKMEVTGIRLRPRGFGDRAISCTRMLD